VAAKDAIEIREIAEATRIRDCADGLAAPSRVGEQMAGARQALIEQEFREGEALGLGQLADVARRHAVPRRERRHGEIARARVIDDVGLDRLQPDRARTANFAARRAVCEIVSEVRGHAAGRGSSACWIYVARTA